MADLLAICDSCSLPFTTSNFTGVDAATVTLIDCSVGPCPYCGGMGSIPSGTYSLVRDTMRLLRAAPRQQLADLADVLHQHREAPDLAARVKTAAPELAEALRTPGQAAIDWKFWVPVLLALLSFLLGPAYANLFEDEPAPPPYVSELIQQLLDEQNEPAPAAGKIGRNQACPCGSGSKYKRCHGSPGSVSGAAP